MLIPLSHSLRSKRFRRVWEQRKTEERTGFSVFCLRGKWGESQNKNGGGRGGEGRNRLQTNPWILKTPFAGERGSWLAGLVEHCSTSECRKEGGDAFEACLQKALTFLTEWVFSRELRQYRDGRNPVVQCQRFGISKPAHYCRRNCDTICSCSFNFKVKFLN